VLAADGASQGRRKGSVPSKITLTGTFANTACLFCSACRPATLFPTTPFANKGSQDS